MCSSSNIRTLGTDVATTVNLSPRTNPHGKMSAITQASAQVAKTVAVTTGKVSNAKSMMIWRPHGNKYVETKRARERDEMKMKVGEGLAISREGVIIANARCVER